MKIKFDVYSRLLNVIKSWQSREKIIIIESDDWGSIRTSSRSAYSKLLKKGYNMNASKYSLDALESNIDLQELFNVLSNHRDSEGNSACFTANMVMTNPDFKKIKDADFQEYLIEPVSKTLIKQKDRDRVEDLWNEGFAERIFCPQLHAREHIRFWEWMKDLKSAKQEALQTFNLEMCGVPLRCSKVSTSYFLPLFVDDSVLYKENINQETLIKEGANLFKNVFKFESKSTIAPGCGWTSKTEEIWALNGVKYIQGGLLQEHHYANSVKYIPHYLGEKSQIGGLLYLVRNCLFEPSDSKDEEYWKITFKQIEQAFSIKTPAIISSHRVNYIGSICRNNREHSLRQLDLLLKAIVKRWPEVKFLNSTQLGDKIVKTTN